MSFTVYKFLKRLEKVENNNELESQKDIMDLLETLSSVKKISSDYLSSVSLCNIEKAIDCVNDYDESEPDQNSVLAQMILSQKAKYNLQNSKCEMVGSDEDYF